MHYRPVNLTDANWVKGVGRNFSGFFVNHSSENIDRYKVGRKVRFATGDTREIISITREGGYLNIYVDGEHLNGDSVGFPHEIEIVK